MRRLNYLAILFLVMVCHLMVEAEPAILRFEHLGTANGFPTEEMSAMAKDPRGFLWFATLNGLSFYDGANVFTYKHIDGDSNSLPDNKVNDILFDRKGRLWLGTNEGLALFDEHTQHFRTFNLYKTESGKNWCHCLFEDHNGIIWFSCVEGLGKIDPDNFSIHKFRIFGPPEQYKQEWLIGNFLETKNGKFYIGTGSGFFTFDRSAEKFDQVVLPPSGIPFTTNLTDNLIMKTYEDEDDGSIWIGTWGSGLRHYFPGTGQIENYVFSHKPFIGTYNIVMDIFHRSRAEEKNWLWLSSADNGVLIFNKQTHQFTPYTHNPADPYSVSSDFTGHIYDFNDGILWILSPEGINKLDQYSQRFTNFPVHSDEISSSVFRIPVQIAEDNRDPSGNTLWLAMGIDGLLLYDRSSRKVIRRYAHFNIPSEMHNGFDDVQCFYQDKKGTPWFGNEFGLYRLDPESGKTEWFRPGGGDGKKTVYGDYILDITEDKNGVLWMASRLGLLQFDPAKKIFQLWKPVPDSSGKAEENRMRELLIAHDGMIWYGTKARGMGCFNPLTHTFTSYEKKVPVGGIGNFSEDSKGRIWIANYSSLCMFDPATGKSDIYNEQNGLSDDQAILVFVDSHDMVWTATRRGISRIDPETKQVRVFRKEDGLLIDVVQNGFDKGSGDRFYIGWQGLFQEFTPADMLPNPTTFPAAITGFRVLEQDIPLDLYAVSTHQSEVSYKQNILTFRFATPSYSHAEKNQYAYMLEGFDKDWVYCGNRMSATYTNLDGGDYVFKVKAANADGTWNEKPAVFLLHVIPPFWQTNWFRISTIVFLLFVIFVIYRINISRIRKEEKRKTEFNQRVAEAEMKALRAQMNPHFIFNCMNTIDSYVMKSEYEKASLFLNKFSKLIRMVLENSMHRLVTIGSDTQALELYIQLEQQRFDYHFSYTMEIDGELSDSHYKIPPLLLQPYVENAILHGLRHREENGKLSVKIKLLGNTIMATIEDDGVGREKAQELKMQNKPGHKSLGLQVTNERIEIFNFTHEGKALVEVFDLRDEKGRACGTRVELQLPLSNEQQERP